MSRTTHCPSCGAPIEDASISCRYCKSRLDVDLKGLHTNTVVAPESKRRCPHCNVYMQTLDLSTDGPFLIEKCPVCYGFFFDPGELEQILERGVSKAYVIDYALLERLSEEQCDRRETVKYIPCPVCTKLMNRVNFGTRSAVIVDVCREDGVWLDAGELKRLLEWTKAGGQMFHQQVEQERKKVEAQQAKKLAVDVSSAGYGDGEGVELFGPRLPRNPYDFRKKEPGLFDILGDLARYLLGGR